MRGLIDQHILMVFIDGCHVDPAGDQDVGVRRGLADLEDALPRREASEADLAGEHGQLFLVEEFKERDVPEFFRIARHGLISFRSAV